MYSADEYKQLLNSYGSYASWAVWDYEREANTDVIESSLKDLNSRYVLLGLNVSRSLTNIPWINFHGGKHDRKLKYACNDTELRGSYITDLFKDTPEVTASKLQQKLTDEKIAENVTCFIEEMRSVKLCDDSKFILFGQIASKYYIKYFKQHFNNSFIIVRHYSDYSKSDQAWVAEFWQSLGVRGEYSTIIGNYKR
jgi:hypothetical protein